MRVSENRRAAVGFNMTPMIDVVFLLIIFFLVASHFGQQESSVEVELPKAEGGEQIIENETPRLTISIPETGKLYVGGQQRDADKLESILTSEKKRFGDDFQLRVRAGRKIPFQEVEPILKSAARAGIRDVQFAVRE